MAGDDLGDDFVPDELIALSDGEATADEGVGIEEDEKKDTVPAATEAARAAKRKRRLKEKERMAKVYN